MISNPTLPSPSREELHSRSGEIKRQCTLSQTSILGNYEDNYDTVTTTSNRSMAFDPEPSKIWFQLILTNVFSTLNNHAFLKKLFGIRLKLPETLCTICRSASHNDYVIIKQRYLPLPTNVISHDHIKLKGFSCNINYES